MPDCPIPPIFYTGGAVAVPSAELDKADQRQCQATPPQRKNQTVMLAGCLARYKAPVNASSAPPDHLRTRPDARGVLPESFSTPADAQGAPPPAYCEPLRRVNSLHRIQPFSALVNPWRSPAADAVQDTGSNRTGRSSESPDGEQARVDFNRLGNGRLTFCGDSLPFSAGWNAADARDAAMVQGPGIDEFHNVRELKEYVLTRWLAHIDGPTPPDSQSDDVRPLRLTGTNPRLVLLDNVLEHVHQGGVTGFATYSVAMDRFGDHGLMPLGTDMRIEIKPIDGGLRIVSVGQISRMWRGGVTDDEFITAPAGRCLASTEIEFELLLDKAGLDANGDDIYKCVLHPVSAYTDIYDARVKDAFDDAADEQADDGLERLDTAGLERINSESVAFQARQWMQALVNRLLSFLYRLLDKEVEVASVDAQLPATSDLSAKRDGDAFNHWAANLPPRPPSDTRRR